MITPNGGVFGRNPKFNNVTVEGDLVSAGGMTVTPNPNAPTSNVTIGPSAGAAMQSGATNNVCIGLRAADAVQDGDNNIAIGTDALGANVSGSSGVAIGNAALLNSNTTGNVAVGHEALRNATGPTNVAMGRSALLGISGGQQNVGVGDFVGESMNGSNNTIVGHQALRYINSGAACTSSSNSIFIGLDARASGNSQTNQIVIGYQGRGDGSNTTVIGNTSTTSTRLAGTATSVFAISGDTMRITGTRTPASNAAGTAGDFTFGTDGATTYLYYCIASGNWGRVALTTGY